MVATDKRIIDIALEYGYESADSFTKAFTRFHGATPTAVRRGNGAVKSWAVFPCKGPVPDSLQKTEEKIFSEWLPNNSAYEVAEHYNVEMYTCTADYEKGNADESYCCEIWIPVKKRQVQMPGGGF